MSSVMSKPRVIFDRSAFHGASFDELIQSPLLRLSRVRHISVYHTASLIEETASLYLKERNHDVLRKQLSFILDICNERWLRPTEGLWVKELVERDDQKRVVFVPDSEREEMESILRKMAFENFIDQAYLDQIRIEKKEIKQRSKRLHDVLVKMRDDVAQKISKVGVKPSKKSSFEHFAKENLNDFGCDILTRHLKVRPDIVSAMCQRWIENKIRYPYVTAFMTGMLYGAYYAMAEPNQKVDINTQMDIEQLSYMVGVDIIVSNEQKFMKAAFDTLWSPHGKRYMTTNEFVSFIDSM